MVYITDEDYTIKNVNKAVIDRIGKSAGEIIGEVLQDIPREG